jgi:hypothetical protein
LELKIKRMTLYTQEKMYKMIQKLVEEYESRFQLDEIKVRAIIRALLKYRCGKVHSLYISKGPYLDLSSLPKLVKEVERNKWNYFGELNRECKAQGRGICVSYSGDLYEGQFNNGRIHGVGRYIYANGDIYEGEFKSNIRDGYGVLHYGNPEGRIYSGNWKFGLKSGWGT